MNKEQLKARIKVLDDQIIGLSTERRDLRQQLAEASTDLKVGDRVKVEGGTVVWEITAIRSGNYTGQIVFFGSKIRKDGTPGVTTHRIHMWYGQKLVKA